VLVDISDPEVICALDRVDAGARLAAARTRDYVELQLARARVQGLRAGVEYAQALYPNDPLIFDSLAPLSPDGAPLLTWIPAAP
jgi:hypothetical protein